MRWAENRQTTEEEDSAYCLLGIFGVFMLPNYGEEKANAVRRLRKAIKEAEYPDDVGWQQEETRSCTCMIFVGRRHMSTNFTSPCARSEPELRRPFGHPSKS